jgi:hypothetical protein
MPSLETVKLLNAKAQSYRPRSGGDPEITPQDVAAALAKANPAAALYARCCFLGDRNGLRALEREVTHYLLYQKECEEWKVRMLKGIVRLALVEMSGIYPRMTDEERYEILGVHRVSWSRCWKGRYGIVKNLISNWEANVISKLRKHLKRVEVE